jgi:hypothetical protein
MPENRSQPYSDSDAIFIGWQETITEDFLPLFIITARDHPSYQSTVSVTSLRRMGLRIPQNLTPYPGREPSPWHNLTATGTDE